VFLLAAQRRSYRGNADIVVPLSGRRIALEMLIQNFRRVSHREALVQTSKWRGGASSTATLSIRDASHLKPDTPRLGHYREREKNSVI
jgi:hypothetical protein